MKRRTHLTIAVVVLLAVPGLSFAAVTGSPSLSAQFTDDTVAPGEVTTLDVVLLNDGEVDSGSAQNPQLNSEVTTARGVSVRVNSGGAPFDVKTGRQAVGSLATNPGVSEPVSFQVVVPKDAEPGTYDVPVRVSYSYTEYLSEGDGARDQASETRTFRVPVTVEERAAFDVVDVRSNASVGSTGTVAVTVENTGSMTARDTRLSLTTSSSDVTFGEAETGTKAGGTIEPGERRTVEYRVTTSDNADSAAYPFTLSAEYTDGDGQQYSTGDSEAFPGTTVNVTPDPEQSFAVSDVSSTLRVGDDGELSGVVTNTGNRTVSDLVLAWSSEQQNINPTETQYAVGELAPGESSEFDFDVDVSDAARTGPRQFSLVAEYENDQGDQATSDAINVREQVRPATDEFAVDVVDANVSAGESTTVELDLTNTANETLTDISGMLFADAPISADDDEAYVQSLEPGESTTIVYSVSAGAGALEKTYPLSMDFQYDEPDGDTVTTDTYRVPVQVVTENDGGGGFPLALVGGLVLVVVLGVGAFVRYR